MTSALPSETFEELRSYIERDVAAGFLSAEEIVESAVDVLEGEADTAALTAEAERLCAEALVAHDAAQLSWPAVTDCDKLDEAFEDLESRGIVARQNFTCCGTCGAAEIVDEMRKKAASGCRVIGYAFYHAQDTESAAEGHGIYLNYGSTPDSEDGALAIARVVVETLRARGLAPFWDGSVKRRIAVPLDWRRRRGHAA